jgi:hypothetical protein
MRSIRCRSLGVPHNRDDRCHSEDGHGYADADQEANRFE